MFFWQLVKAPLRPQITIFTVVHYILFAIRATYRSEIYFSFLKIKVLVIIGDRFSTTGWQFLAIGDQTLRFELCSLYVARFFQLFTNLWNNSDRKKTTIFLRVASQQKSGRKTIPNHGSPDGLACSWAIMLTLIFGSWNTICRDSLVFLALLFALLMVQAMPCICFTLKQNFLFVSFQNFNVLSYICFQI